MARRIARERLPAAERGAISGAVHDVIAGTARDVRELPQTARNAAAFPAKSILLPLALAQFLNSYGTSAMNVAITDIVNDLGTTVTGVQAAISLYTLVMAAGMITGSKLADIFGRRRVFNAGVIIYGIGGVIAALSPNIGTMIGGWSIIQGIGSDLMIPALYILVTVNFTDLKSRAAAFGTVSAAAGIGGTAGPLIGGVITSAISWRASFALEVPIVLVILGLRGRIVDASHHEKTHLDVVGAMLSALGMIALVLGALIADTYGWVKSTQALKIGGTTILPEGGISPVIILFIAGIVLLLAFGGWQRLRERRGRDPLVPVHILLDRVAVPGLLTQFAQWFLQLGSLFILTLYLQQTLGFNAIQTGLTMLPMIIGLLVLSRRAAPLAKKHSNRTIIQSGFVVTELGVALFLILTPLWQNAWSFVPSGLLLGAGIGLIMPASVNLVQSAASEADQAAISGVSRSASNLGSSLGTAVAGSVLVVAASSGVSQNSSLAFGLVAVAGCALVGLAASFFLPGRRQAP